MVLNKQTGNMYGWVNYTWNPISGRCPHECTYCYMKGFKLKELHLKEDELKRNLGTGNTIFLGSGTDMFAATVPGEWIRSVLAVCCKFDNTYLFQTKAPARFSEFEGLYPEKTIFGTTIETDAYGSEISKAPGVAARSIEMQKLREAGKRVMVSVEPVLDYDTSKFAAMLVGINPEFVSIGADSKGHKMPEPTPQKIRNLVTILKGHGIKVIPKPTLARLVPDWAIL